MARTETVTVVFTDLVGSTELASRLGHDAYEALRLDQVARVEALGEPRMDRREERATFPTTAMVAEPAGVARRRAQLV